MYGQPRQNFWSYTVIIGVPTSGLTSLDVFIYKFYFYVYFVSEFNSKHWQKTKTCESKCIDRCLGNHGEISGVTVKWGHFEPKFLFYSLKTYTAILIIMIEF